MKDELETIAGTRDRLAGLLQEKYGLAKAEAERPSRVERSSELVQLPSGWRGPPHLGYES
jgi:hypothetical protein